MNEKNNVRGNRKRAIESGTVKIAIGICLAALVAMLLPCIRFSDEAVMVYRNIDYNEYNIIGLSAIEAGFSGMAAVMGICFLLTGVLFVFDHPKLSLLGSITGLMVSGTVMAVLGEYASEGGSLTPWPVMIVICAVVLIVFAFITKKANPKYIKVKVA